MNVTVGAAKVPHRAIIQRFSLLCLFGIALYMLLDLLLFFLRPDLPLLHHAESDYGNGAFAWVMDINFLLRCLLSLAAAGALWYALPRTSINQVATWLLIVWAIASGVLAFFPDDYEGAPVTTHGRIHLAAASVAFLCCLLATLLFTRELARRWGRHWVVILLAVFWLIAALGLILLATIGFRPGRPDGLYERVFLGFELVWLAAAMSRLYRLNAVPSGGDPGMS